MSATFETYWNDIEFETCAAGDIQKMRDALAGGLIFSTSNIDSGMVIQITCLDNIFH